jgi:hypothetical protein
MEMTPLTWFGLFAVSMMLLCDAFEQKSHWFVFGFSIACVLGSIYGFLEEAWPFGVVEAIWAVISLNKWRLLLEVKR